MEQCQEGKVFPMVSCLISLLIWFTAGAIFSWWPMISHGADQNFINWLLLVSWLSFHAVIIFYYTSKSKLVYVVAAVNIIIWFLSASYIWSN